MSTTLRRALAILGLLAPLAVLLGGHLLMDRRPLAFVSGSVTGPDGRTTPIALPYASDHEPQAARYRYALDFKASASPRSRLRIIPDDCLRSLAIDGAAVPLTSVPAAGLCDYRAGFEIDVGNFLHPGANHFDVVVENVSGRHGLGIYSVRGGYASEAGSIALLLLLVPACFVAVRPLGRGALQGWTAAVLLALAGWLRYRFVFDWHPPEHFVFSDMAGYVDRAHEIVLGEAGEHQTFQPIGYSLALALSLRWVGDLTLAGWSHVLLGWATVALIWRATTRWLRSRAGLWALGIAALHFEFISLSGFFLAETYFTFQLALLYYCLARFAFPWRASRAFFIGLVYMSGLWLKGNNTFFGPLIVVWVVFWVVSHRHVPRRLLARRLLVPVIALCAGAAVIVASYAAFTHFRYGHAHVSASTASLNFIEGKCPEKRNMDSEGHEWLSPLFVQLGESEQKRWPRPFTDGAYFWAAGVDCIRKDPWVLATSLRYVYYLFFDNQLWPANATGYAGLARTSGMLSSAFFFPMVLLGYLVIGRRPSRRSALFALMGLSIMVCSWFFKSELRYRVPFDVVFIPIAVLGASFVVTHLRRATRIRR